MAKKTKRRTPTQVSARNPMVISLLSGLYGKRIERKKTGGASYKRKPRNNDKMHGAS